MNKKVKRVLIAEDEKPMATALKLKLEGSGHKVKVAKDGDETMKELSNNNFDILLLDLIMPKRDGFKVLEDIKAKKIKIKIIVLSNLGQPEDETRAKKAGAIDFFIKSDTPITKIIDYINKL